MRTPMRRTVLLSVCLLFLGCSLLDQILNKVDTVVAAFDRAISTLAQESQSWQGTLLKLEQELIAKGQSTLANEVQSLLNRGIATAGTELRCNADFVGNRMRQGLERIRARLQGQPVPLVEPAYCQVVPEAVDLRLEPSRRNTLSFYGYDMDAAGANLQVFLQDDRGETEVTSWSALPTHYLMTLNTVNLPFSATSRKLVVRWGAKTLSTINVLVPPPPPAAPQCNWSGWACGSMSCSPNQYLSGVDFNATEGEACWGRGNDMDEPNRRIKCCNLPSAANNCYWSGWSCGDLTCPSGHHVAGVDFNATANEACWGRGDDYDEPNRRLYCCQTPPVGGPGGACFTTAWGCGPIECPANYYVSGVDFGSKGEGCWGAGPDTDEPVRRLHCCPLP